MQKTLAILALFTFVTISVSAQSKRLTTFGLKGGFNGSIITGEELTGAATGFIGFEAYVSLLMDTELNQKWRFENELLFSFTDDYHFLEIPLRLKYPIHPRVLLAAGPKLDLALNNDDAIYDFNTVGVSVEAGIQYDLTKRILAEMRYAHGLLPQINDFALDIYNGTRNTFRLGIGYRF